MKFKPRNKKVLVRSTAALGALLICGGAITSSPLVMHADDTTSTHTETVAPTGTTLDNTKWTAVDKDKTITRTIHYIDEDGKTVAPDVVETHTGEVFTTKNGDQTVNRAFTIVNGVATNVVPKFASVVSPSVRGYKLKSTQYSTIPEQGWSLDGTQTKDPKTGFYSNLSQDEVINVVYTKDPTTALKDEVPVPGYTVLNVKNMTRTINYVDEEGNKLADSAVETVKYETVASDKLTPKEQQDEKNQKVAVVQVLRDTNGNVTSENTSILSTPAYKLKDVKSPKIAGMKLQNKKFATLTGQYMWLSDQPYVHATLDNGLPQYMTQDEIVDVIYVKADAKDTQKDKKNKQNKKTKNAVAGAVDKKNNGGSGSDANCDGKDSGSASTGSSSNAGSGDVGGSGSADVGSGDIGGSGSSATLPQTGNKKSSSVLLGSGVALMLSSVAMAWDGLKRKFLH